jgi:hypothetical protein
MQAAKGALYRFLQEGDEGSGEICSSALVRSASAGNDDLFCEHTARGETVECECEYDDAIADAAYKRDLECLFRGTPARSTGRNRTSTATDH